MYVCVCSALRESQVRRAIREEGTATPDEVFACLGAEPCCRMCVPDIHRLIQEEGVLGKIGTCQRPRAVYSCPIPPETR